MNRLSFPTILTLFRLVVSPLILPVFFVYLLPLNNEWINGALFVLFFLVAMTDFFDGYLARRYNWETALGRWLDPIADKFLLYATLIGLLAAGKIYFYWVILLIGREFFIMGLRTVALSQKIVIPVSYLGKAKTMVQMVCLSFIIYNPYQSLGLFGSPWWNGAELVLLAGALALSLVSAYQYNCSFWVQQECV